MRNLHPRNSHNKYITSVVLAAKKDIETTHLMTATGLEPTKYLSVFLRTKCLRVRVTLQSFKPRIWRLF